MDYEKYIGKELKVVRDGYGFCERYLGGSFKIIGYDVDGYGGERPGFIVEGYENKPFGYVGVESFDLNLGEDIDGAPAKVPPNDQITEASVENIQALLGTAYAEDISVYITVDSVKVYWKHYEFVVDNKVSLGKIIECIDVLEGQLVNE